MPKYETFSNFKLPTVVTETWEVRISSTIPIPVTVDGTFAGISPVTIQLVSGIHQITVPEKVNV